VRRKRVVAGTLGLVALAMVVAALARAHATYRSLYRSYGSFAAGPVVVEIPPSASARHAVARLAAAGVIESAPVALAYLTWTKGATKLQAGEYQFDHPATTAEVLERIQRGDILLHRLTVPEGLRLDETAKIVAEAGFGTEAEVLRAFRDPAPLKTLDSKATDLEGYLFPETYWFPKGETPAAVARAMVTRFSASIGPDFVSRARAYGMSVREAVTLASLIEEETGVPDERPRIARVFHNRIARRMPLQCDPTVLYALHRAGRPVATLKLADLQFNSPWNSYRNVGLPPGPIASPSAASLQAAVAPAPGADLYFVAAPAGGHTFSPDLAAHERAVQVWRRYLRSSR